MSGSKRKPQLLRRVRLLSPTGASCARWVRWIDERYPYIMDNIQKRLKSFLLRREAVGGRCEAGRREMDVGDEDEVK